MFYENFIILCSSKNKSPSTVLKELGINKSCFSNWKNGSIPTDAHLNKIANYFDTTILHLRSNKIDKINHSNSIFYENFLTLCNKANLSPSKLGEEIGVSKPAVHRWKHGSIPSDTTIQKLSKRFNVSREYFFTDNSQSSISNPSNKQQVSNRHEKIIEILNIAQELPDNKLDALYATAKAII